MKFFDVIQKVAELLLTWHKAKEDKEHKKEIQQKEDEAQNIANHGTIADLLDFGSRNIILIAAIVVLLSGCKTTEDIVMMPTKPWENHYYTVEDFQKGTRDIQLEKNESIWVMSNRTLLRVLKDQINNTGK